MDTQLQRPADRLDRKQVVLGREITLSLANGEKRRARFALVAAGALLASHNERTFALTAGYPTLPDGRSVNDRNYAADRNAQAEVRRMAQNLDAARMITTSRTPAGTPIITTDGIVVSGNNRTMSLKLAIEEFPEQYAEYERLLREELAAFGLDRQVFSVGVRHEHRGWFFHFRAEGSESVEMEITNPVLVRIDYDFPEYSPAELAKYNQDTKKGERPVDRALKLAAQLRAHGGAARILSTELGAFDTFSEFYANHGAVRTVREALLTAGVVLPQEASTYFADNGTFTEAGRQLIERAAAGLVLSPEALIASEADGMGTIRQVVATSLPVLLANDKLPAAWRLTEALSAAVVLQHKISRSATAGGPSAALPAFSAYVRTPQLDEAAPPRAAMVLNRLLVAGRRTFKAALEAYNQSAEEAAGGISMFGAVTPAEAFAGHLEKRLDADTLRVIQMVAGADTAADAPEPFRFAPGDRVRHVETRATGSVVRVFRDKGDNVAEVNVDGLAQPHTVYEDELVPAAPAGGAPGPAVAVPVAPAGAPASTLINGNWFKQHPEKLLGAPKQVSTRFGGTGTVLTGSLADALVRVTAPDRHPAAAPAHSVATPTPQALLAGNPDTRHAAAMVVQKSQRQIADRAVKQTPSLAAPAAAEVHSFDSALYALNNESGLTDAHFQCFAWTKEQDGDPLQGEFAARFSIAPTPERLRRWVEMGIAAFDGNRYRYAPLFYSGSYYERREELMRHRETIEEAIGPDNYLRQLQELDRRRPAALTVTDPQINRRLMLKPISALAREFIIDTLADGEPFTYQQAGKNKWDPSVTVTYRPSLYRAFFLWLNKLPPSTYRLGTSVHEVQSYYLQSAPLSNPDNDARVEAENTRIRQRSRLEGERLFAEFLATQLTPADQARLEAQWNATFNAWIPVDLKQVPVCFRWAKADAKGLPLPVKWEKREAVAGLLSEGALILAYDVGVGKTFSATFAIAQFLEFGYCKRPLIVTPNQVYKQFIAEIKGLLPHVQVNGFYNMGAGMKDKIDAALDADGRVPAGSITVITKEGLEQIGLLPDTLSRMTGEFFTILNQGGASARESAALEARIGTMLGKSQKGSSYAMEELGFDFLCVDEAHSLKKSFTKVKGKTTAGGSREKHQYDLQSGEPSALALRGFCLAYYVMANNHWRNVLLLTATPFTNSPLEVFSMLALVAYRKLEKMGQNSLVDFFDTFINVSNQLTVTASMKLDFKQVVLGYNNLIILQKLVRRFILYKSGEDVGVERPNKVVLPLTLRRDEAGNVLPLAPGEQILTRLPMTAQQQLLMDDVLSYVDGKTDLDSICLGVDTADNLPGDDAATISTRDEDRALNEEEKKGVRVLRGINMARNIALSPYLISCSRVGMPSARDYVETSPKLDYVMRCIRAVRDHHVANGEPVSGQIIYMDRGIQFFPLLREYLIHAVGFAPHEVALVSSGLSADQKERVKNGFLGKRVDKDGNVTDLPHDERIKVIIGSSTIKEGLNLQRWGTVLYNCFIDWNPTDVKQLEGRIWRFGNLYANVVIVNPMLENSADAFIYQKLEEKSARINEIWEQAGQENALKLEEFNPGELKMALLTAPRRAAEAQIAEDKANAQGEVDQLRIRIEEVRAISKFLPIARDLLAEYRAFVFGLLTPEQQEKARDGWDARDYESLRRRHIEISAADAYKYRQEKVTWGKLKALQDARRAVAWGQIAILDAFQLTEEGLPAFAEQLEAERAAKAAQVEANYGEAAIEQLAGQIAAQRQANSVVRATVEDRVAEFTKVLPLLRQLAPGEKLLAPRPRKAPKYTTCPPRLPDGAPAVDDEALEVLRRCLFELPSTKSLHVDGQGRYTPERLAVHQRIIEKFAVGKPCVLGKPVCVLTGGLPGSGKSYLIKNSSFKWVNDEHHVVHVDADAVRAELPEYEGWNANQTHEETKDLVTQILDRVGTPCTTDLVYDGTMNKIKSYLPLIKKLRELGYDIYVLFVRVPFEVSRQRVLERYQRTGRYVPIEVIQDAYNQGDDALIQMKTMVDGYIVYDGVSGEMLEKGGRAIPTSRQYEVAAAPTAKSAPPTIADDADRARKLKLARARAEAQKQRVRVLQLAHKRRPTLVTVPE